MKLYHMDRAGTLKENESISLLPLDNLAPDISNSIFLKGFQTGISYHGRNYLNTSVSLMNSFLLSFETEPYIALPTAPFNYQKSHVDAQIIELVCELVRRTYFPQYSSRFISLFCVKNILDFQDWPELNSPQKQIFEIEAPDDTPKFDANMLRGGLIFNSEPNRSSLGFHMSGSFDFAYKYWAGEKTDSPRWEYLVPLPIDKPYIKKYCE